MTELTEVLKRLPRLAPSELARVQARLALLTKPFQDSDNEDWLLAGISIELRRRGVWSGSGSIPRNLLTPGYATKAQEAREFLLKGVGANKLRRNEQIALGILAGAAIVDRFNRVGVPLSPRAILNSLNQLGPALEDAFPGYWGNAALGVCLKLVS